GLFYAALFLIYGIHLPYLPVWLDWRGLGASEIGLVTAAPFFVRLAVTPVVAVFADQYGAHRSLVIALAWSALAASVALAMAPGFWSILLVAVVLSLAITTIMPLVETVAVSGVRNGGLDYGRMRLWGSVAFVAATFAGGAVIARAGAAAGVWMIVLGAALTALAAHLLPHPRLAAGAERGRDPGREPAPVRMPRLDDARELLRSPVFLLFLVAAGAIQGAHATFYTFGALHWGNQGIKPVTVGVLWTIGVAAEIALFAWSGLVMQRMWATTLLIAGGVAAVARWLLMAFDPPLAALLPLQVLHGVTYGAAHLGAIHFIARAVPDTTAGTAQAIYATVAAGIAMGAATLLSGHLFARYGGGGAYAGMTLVAAIGLAAAIMVRRLWDGERLGSAPPAALAEGVRLSPEEG
ncbi:MAG: MFS transporter, partial [Hyphomicrobium sp.]